MTYEEFLAMVDGKEVLWQGRPEVLIVRQPTPTNQALRLGTAGIEDVLYGNHAFEALVYLFLGEDGVVTRQQTYGSGQSHTSTYFARRDYAWSLPETPELGDWRKVPYVEPPNYAQYPVARFEYQKEWPRIAMQQLESGLTPWFYCLTPDLRVGDVIVDRLPLSGPRFRRIAAIAHHDYESVMTLTQGEVTQTLEQPHLSAHQLCSADGTPYPPHETWFLIYRPGSDIVSLSEWAETHAKDVSNARKLAHAGRIPGAYKSGDLWLLPGGAQVISVPQGAAAHHIVRPLRKGEPEGGRYGRKDEGISGDVHEGDAGGAARRGTGAEHRAGTGESA